jgi:hypothetical protein
MVSFFWCHEQVIQYPVHLDKKSPLQDFTIISTLILVEIRRKKKNKKRWEWQVQKVIFLWTDFVTRNMKLLKVNFFLECVHTHKISG